MSKKLFTLLAALLAISLIAVACGNDDDGPATPVASTAPPEETAEEPVEETAEEPAEEPMDDSVEESAVPGTIVEVAVESGAFPTLVAAVQAAGLVETLSGEGPFTVFAPTEEAFGAALAALGLSAEELLGDVDLLTAVLTYHVLPVAAPAEVVLGLDGQSVATVGGEDVQITVDGGSVMVNDATVVTADIEASNGIIHVIDKVLIPPSLR
ncbi:fasciclin domain-containing protein [Candidatus Poriferisocius sp.]|uniref:fasciclin domain-containing protein n=1 Tax=Candidatus Poriferisocius sp. TaxID=3101276 RepID=UPI003B5D02CB